MRKAFITGILGQDGSYLAELLLEKDYEVFGLLPARSKTNYENVKNIKDQITFIPGNMTDAISLNAALCKVRPDEIYNLAARSFVQTSWYEPEHITEVNYLGVLYLLEAMRAFVPNARFYQASTSEMYGNSYPNFSPVSPYGVAKLAAHQTVINYRDTYKLFACSGICFNHESPRRGDHFVTQKIVKAAVRIKAGLQEILELGNINSERDFGHAKDYVYAMWLMLQQEKPCDYQICSGKTFSIKFITDYIFSKLNLNWTQYVEYNKKYNRPIEINTLRGNPYEIKIKLEWSPKYTFETLFDEMIEYAQKELNQ